MREYTFWTIDNMHFMVVCSVFWCLLSFLFMVTVSAIHRHRLEKKGRKNSRLGKIEGLLVVPFMMSMLMGGTYALTILGGFKAGGYYPRLFNAYGLYYQVPLSATRHFFFTTADKMSMKETGACIGRDVENQEIICFSKIAFVDKGLYALSKACNYGTHDFQGIVDGQVGTIEHVKHEVALYHTSNDELVRTDLEELESKYGVTEKDFVYPYEYYNQYWPFNRGDLRAGLLAFWAVNLTAFAILCTIIVIFNRVTMTEMVVDER